jgi:Flp pilus assembly protein TadG
MTDPHRDRGAATLFVVGLSVMLFVLAGLVVDGGLAINARANAADIAEQAARAGAKEIDEAHLRATGQVRIDGVAARAAANDFLQDSGFMAKPNAARQITVSAAGDEIQVAVRRDYQTYLTSLIFINKFTVAAEATARPAVGIEDEL